MPTPPKVFISHTTQDQRDLSLAQTLARGLRAGGADVWIAPDRIPSGARWEREIVEAILNKCNYFIVILSAASIAADWVQKEIELARKRHENDETFQILPLPVGKIGSYPNRDFIAQFQNLTYFEGLDDQLHEIGRVLKLFAVPWTEYLRNVVRELNTISLVPGQKRVPIEEITPIRVARLSQNREGNPSIESHDIADLPRLASKVVLVGPGGCGKTTALQWLTHRFATELLEPNVDRVNKESRTVETIPVFAHLGSYTNSLIGLIQQILSNRGVMADEAEIRFRFGQSKILLLLDSFDEVSNKRKLVSDLQELLVLAPNTPIILSSRLVSPLGGPLFTRFERFDVEALDNSQVKAVFSLLLDQAKAESLLRLIEERKLIEAFRQPLMACLVATSNQQDDEQDLPLSKGALYKEIVSYFVRQWEAQRQERLLISDAFVKIACLNRVGYSMTVRNETSLSEEEFEKLCLDEMRQTGVTPKERVGLTEDLFSTGLLKRATEGVSFSHLSFRDFFSASWLKEHFSLRMLLRLSWQPQWHEVFGHLAGLLSYSQASELLRWMLIFSRVSISAARIGPYAWSANQILLTLNCLGNTNESHNTLKNQITTRLIGGDVYLSNATITPDQTVPRGLNGIYAYFCVLVGRLRTEEALQLLKQHKSRQTRVCGLAQFWDMQILLQEFEDPDTRDGGVADSVAADFILRFRADTIVDGVENFLRGHEISQKKRLLEALHHCLSAVEGMDQKHALLAQDNRWFPLMANIALNDEDEELRDSALGIIRCFGEYQFHLPKPAETIIKNAAREAPDEAVRRRALWYLTYAESHDTLDLLREFVGSGSEWLTLTALDALRYRDRENFPDHMASALRRLNGTVFIEEVQALAESLMESVDWTEAASTLEPQKKETLKYLIAGALLHERYLVRGFSIEALFITGLKPVAPVLIIALSLDESDAVREKALLGLEALLDADAEPYIYKAFEDKSPLVRKMAITSFYRLPEALGVKAIPKLQEIGRSDPDDSIRRTALAVAERFIKGDRW